MVECIIRSNERRFGDYFISCPITIMTKKRNASNAASPELARIKGKRIGVLQEPESHERLNVGIMKELTGNDSFMARGLFQEPFEIKPQIKFWLTCNVLPIVPSRDGGTWRRIVALDFGSKFVEKPEKPNEFKIDKTLKSKLPEWAPVFMGFLIDNYIKTYKVKGLIEPEELNIQLIHTKWITITSLNFLMKDWKLWMIKRQLFQREQCGRNSRLGSKI